jgi:hypothetical protein
MSAKRAGVNVSRQRFDRAWRNGLTACNLAISPNAQDEIEIVSKGPATLCNIWALSVELQKRASLNNEFSKTRIPQAVPTFTALQNDPSSLTAEHWKEIASLLTSVAILVLASEEGLKAVEPTVNESCDGGT